MADRNKALKSNISESTRALVAKLARASNGGLLDVSTASKALDTNPKATAIKLAALVKTGWLLRAKRGLYFILPLEATPGQNMMSDDPWLLANKAFAPCYIGGWSAAEYWELTEQLFRSTLVVTAANIRTNAVKLLNHEFRLFQVEPERVSSAIKIWRGSEQVMVSDREQTIIDCLRNPELCGGINHLTHIMSEYLVGGKANFPALLKKAEATANGATWKRLGFLSELLWPKEKTIVNAALKNLTTGYIKLDTKIRSKGTMNSRWRLWANVNTNTNS